MNDKNSFSMKTSGMRPAFERKRSGGETFSAKSVKLMKAPKLPKTKVQKIKVPKFTKNDFSNMPNPGR